LCSSLLCHPNIRRVFRRLCLSLNICSFEGIFDRNCIRITSFRASSAFNIFEAGLRSLELSLLGQQRLQDIRGRASVPRIISFGPAAPSTYSRQGFGLSNYLFRASSAFKIFEAGLRSLELSLSGQQRLQDIRGRASVPRIISFGPAAPSRYSRPGFGPSNCLFGPVVTSKNSNSNCGPSNHPF
jgi:hypothetical protein